MRSTRTAVVERSRIVSDSPRGRTAVPPTPAEAGADLATSPRMVSQRAMLDAVTRSPRMAAQKRQMAVVPGAAAGRAGLIAPPRRGEGPVQRSVGLEIEIAVPVDGLTGPQRANLSAYVTGHNPPAAGQAAHAQGLADLGHVGTFQNIFPGVAGFHVDTDHDDRVKSPAGIWPPREAGDAILEIVMDPAVSTNAQLNTTMTNIQAFVTAINANTNNLTTHWVNAGGGGFNFGPLHLPAYAAAGIPATRRANHNFRGSIQANVGVDLREYHSMLKWYAGSKYRPRTVPGGTPFLNNQTADMQNAVNIGRTAVDHIRNTGFPPAAPPLTALQVQQMGNLRGLRGWLTHAALALIRGNYTWGLAGSVKNIVPVLLKSQNDLVLQHGLTAAEMAYYIANNAAIVAYMLNATGRVAMDPVFQDLAFKAGGVPGGPGAVGWTITDLFDETLNDAAFIVPASQRVPSDVGPARGGNAQVTAIPDAPVLPGLGGGPGRRAGMVLEFRTINGLYDGMNAWKALAKKFLKEANKRNTRDGLTT